MAYSGKLKADLSEGSKFVLWTRMQAEAGQGLELIIKRKEREREAGSGLFFWGVGNAPLAIINSVARMDTPVTVVFSRMKSKPKQVDQKPATTVIWRRYVDCEGKVRDLPPNALVTSRGESALRSKRIHYALECRSVEPLRLNDRAEQFHPSAYRNAGGTGAPVGNSQVTSLLLPAKGSPPDGPSAYFVHMRAVLAGSYWVKLLDPLPLPSSALEVIDRAHIDQLDWTAFVTKLREGPVNTTVDDDAPLLLL
jgi:hypothetical protein